MSAPFDLPAESAKPVRLVVPNSNKRELLLTPASAVRLRRPTWLYDTAPIGSLPQDSEGRIPIGSLTIAAGMAGIGKSQFTAWLAARETTGMLPGCHYGTPKSVIIAATEDSREMTIGPRLVAAGADMSRVFFVDVVDDGDQHAQLTLPVDTAALAALIAKHDVALLICDPLLSTFGSDVNDYRGKEVRAALGPLIDVADQTKCAVVGLAHFNKAAPSGDPLLAIQGAAAFGQLIRAGIGFAREEATEGDEPTEPTFVMSTVKNNLGRDNLPSLQYRIAPTPVETEDGTAWVSRFEFTGRHSERSVKEIMRSNAEGKTGEDTTTHSEIERFIIEYLQECGGSAPAKEISAAGVKAGFKDTAITKARFNSANPKIKSARRGFGKGSVVTWSIDSGIDAIGTDTRRQGSMDSMPESTETSGGDSPPGIAAQQVFPVSVPLCRETGNTPECPECSGPTDSTGNACFTCSISGDAA